MMETALFELQRAVVSTLRGYTPLTSIVTAIADDVEEEEILPYVSLGLATATDDSNKTFYAEECTMTISAWSSYKGKKEAIEILNEISKALTEDRLTMADGFECGTVVREMIEVFKDPDTPKVYQGVVRFRFTINQVQGRV